MGKNRVPILLRVIRSVFPLVEKVFPDLANRFLWFIFFTPFRYGIPEKEKAIEAEAEKSDVEIAGKRIQCYTWGSGPVVMLVHGWAGRATQFRKMIPALVAEGFRVVGFDGPAHGRSEGRSTDIMEFEMVLRALVERHGPPHGIIAHSFGGGAVLYAATKGLQFHRVINIASPSIGDEIINMFLRTVRGSAATGNAFRERFVATTGKHFDEFTALYFARQLDHPPALLLVHDEDDRQVPIIHAIELKKVYPGAELFRTRGLGHTRILRDSGVISRCVSFLKGSGI